MPLLLIICKKIPNFAATNALKRMYARNFHIFFVLLASLALLSCKSEKTRQNSPSVDTIPMMVMQIQKCSRLYTAECHVHKIITHEDKKKLKGKPATRRTQDCHSTRRNPQSLY